MKKFKSHLFILIFLSSLLFLTIVEPLFAKLCDVYLRRTFKSDPVKIRVERFLGSQPIHGGQEGALRSYMHLILNGDEPQILQAHLSSMSSDITDPLIYPESPHRFTEPHFVATTQSLMNERTDELALNAMLKKGIVTEEEAMLLRQENQVIRPIQVSTVEILEPQDSGIDKTTSSLRLISGQTAIKDSSSASVQWKNQVLPWTLHYPEIASQFLDRNKFRFIWELGRAVSHRPKQLQIDLDILSAVAYRELLIQGGNLEHAYLFAHSNHPLTTRYYQEHYGFQIFAHTGKKEGDSVLYAPLKSFLSDDVKSLFLSQAVDNIRREKSMSMEEAMDLQKALQIRDKLPVDIPNNQESGLTEGLVITDKGNLSDMRKMKMKKDFSLTNEEITTLLNSQSNTKTPLDRVLKNAPQLDTQLKQSSRNVVEVSAFHKLHRHFKTKEVSRALISVLKNYRKALISPHARNMVSNTDFYIVVQIKRDLEIIEPMGNGVIRNVENIHPFERIQPYLENGFQLVENPQKNEVLSQLNPELGKYYFRPYGVFLLRLKGEKLLDLENQIESTPSINPLEGGFQHLLDQSVYLFPSES